MILKVFAVFDSKASTFGHPFFCHTRGVAIRSFSDAANDSKHEFGRHAADFTLFEIGEYDDQTGKFVNLAAPESIGVALQFVEVAQKAPLALVN